MGTSSLVPIEPSCDGIPVVGGWTAAATQIIVYCRLGGSRILFVVQPYSSGMGVAPAGDLRSGLRCQTRLHVIWAPEAVLTGTIGPRHAGAPHAICPNTLCWEDVANSQHGVALIEIASLVRGNKSWMDFAEARTQPHIGLEGEETERFKR